MSKCGCTMVSVELELSVSQELFPGPNRMALYSSCLLSGATASMGRKKPLLYDRIRYD